MYQLPRLERSKKLALQKELAEAELRLDEIQREGSYLRQEVTPDDIAGVVARWTGIPVEKMLEGELERLTKMEGRLRSAWWARTRR